jgi:hypothetical protein
MAQARPADSVRAGPGSAGLTIIATLRSLAFCERMCVPGGSFADEALRNNVGLLVAGLAREKGDPADETAVDAWRVPPQPKV